MPRDIITFQCTECKNRNYSKHQEQEDHDGADRTEEILPATAGSTSRTRKSSRDRVLAPGSRGSRAIGA